MKTFALIIDINQNYEITIRKNVGYFELIYVKYY